MAKNNKLILSLVLFGLLSLALSLFLSTQTDKTTPGVPAIANAQMNLGSGSILRKNLTRKEILSRRTALFPQDSVETASDGDATLDFPSGDRLHLQEDTLITVDREKERTVVIIKRGDLQVEAQGSEGLVYISRDGQRYSPAEYEEKRKMGSLADHLPESAPTADTSSARGNSSSLTPEMIQDVLRAHRPAFFRCYTQLLQKTPGVVGQASMSFTIERTGKVSMADVTASSLNDPPFKKCLLDAVRRVEFKSFSGDAISTVFPLRFE